MKTKCLSTKRTGLFGLWPAFCLFLSLSALSPLSAFAQEAAPQRQESEQTLEQLGTAIHTSLAALKARSQSLTEELQGQKLIVEEYKTKLNELSICLTNTNEKLYAYETKLIKSEEKNRQLAKTRNRLILILSLMIGLFVAVRAVTIALRKIGVKLPEIVNILL